MKADPITNRLAAVWIEMFENNEELFLRCLVDGTCHRHVLVRIYNMIVKDNSVPALGYLPESERLTLWERSKKLAAGRMNNSECIELSKALYTLDLILAR